MANPVVRIRIDDDEVSIYEESDWVKVVYYDIQGHGVPLYLPKKFVGPVGAALFGLKKSLGLANEDYPAFEATASTLRETIAFSLWGNSGEDEFKAKRRRYSKELLQAGCAAIVDIEKVYDLIPKPEE